MTTLKGKIALVTGSTSGIGQAIARALAREGAHITLHGLGDTAEIERTRSALATATGVTINYLHEDFRSPDAAARLVRRTEEIFGAVDILINNAGLQHVSPVEDFPPERWTLLQDIILNASFHAIRAVVPGMKRRDHGRIINLASAHGLIASPFKSAYVAAKHGLIGLTRSVALELAETGVTCNAICPGYVRTPLVENQIDDQARAHGISREKVIREIILATQPSKRFVEIEEIAALTVFLCGENARSITGAALPIDGGWTAR